MTPIAGFTDQLNVRRAEWLAAVNEENRQLEDAAMHLIDHILDKWLALDAASHNVRSD